jgi:hypothetical protein
MIIFSVDMFSYFYRHHTTKESPTKIKLIDEICALNAKHNFQLFIFEGAIHKFTTLLPKSILWKYPSSAPNPLKT